MTAEFRLDATYKPGEGDSPGTMRFALHNLSDAPLSDFALAYSALTRMRFDGIVEGGRLVRRIANFHEIEPNSGLTIEPGDAWIFDIDRLANPAQHRSDGPKSAYLTMSDGRRAEVAVGDLRLEGGEDSGQLKQMPPGATDVAMSVTPWPRQVQVEVLPGRPPALALEPSAEREVQQAVSRIAELANRLFPVTERPFVLQPGPVTRALRISQDPTLSAHGYAITFAAVGVNLAAGGPIGRDYGLITLAHIHHGAATDPVRFGFPSAGVISDAPRYAWRGSHLDVSRHFYPMVSVRRFVDILAWLKMNVLQWHLTDDEGWRLEIEALPELTTIGARRGADHEMVPQHGGGAVTYAGHYSRQEVRDLVDHATSLHVDVVPEIDVPGHCTAVLHALPHLRDPDEPEENYHSIQGYPNNALNPAMPATYDFMHTVLKEVADLFPSPYIHIGGDEVDEHSWLGSPLAQAFMAREGLKSTADLQLFFFKRIRETILGLGKKIAGWDEVGDGGDIPPEDTLLVAWRDREKIAELMRAGYDVVASPGQRFYLDMVQGSGWYEPGTGWAGPVPPRESYEYEPADELPEGTPGKLVGVQAAIWSEHLTTREQFNHMVFPRLGSVAEAGWTPADAKNWQRFAALSRLLPEL
jgi:hexosaminidase